MTMLAMKRDCNDAAAFLDGITAKPLSGSIRERAIEDFIRCSPLAWLAWLQAGSREDWTERVRRVTCPALVITGADDPSLPAAVQQQTTLRHLTRGQLKIIPSCGHLPTMEAPQALSALIRDFVESGRTSNETRP